MISTPGVTRGTVPMASSSISRLHLGPNPRRQRPYLDPCRASKYSSGPYIYGSLAPTGIENLEHSEAQPEISWRYLPCVSFSTRPKKTSWSLRSSRPFSVAASFSTRRGCLGQKIQGLAPFSLGSGLPAKQVLNVCSASGAFSNHDQVGRS